MKMGRKEKVGAKKALSGTEGACSERWRVCSEMNVSYSAVKSVKEIRERYFCISHILNQKPADVGEKR